MITALAGLGMLGAAAAVMHSSKAKAGKALTKDLGLEFGVDAKYLPPSRRVVRAVEKHGFVWLDDTGEIR
jgi:hypothetical protein